MNNKNLYVCKSCHNFFSGFISNLETGCPDCNGPLEKIDVDYAQYSEWPDSAKQAFQKAYLKSIDHVETNNNSVENQDDLTREDAKSNEKFNTPLEKYLDDHPRKKKRKEKKKRSCLSQIAAVMFVVLFVAYMSSSKNDPSVNQTPTDVPLVTAVPTHTTVPTTAPTSAPKSTSQPSIAGSQVYDIILSLEDKGIPKAATQTSKDASDYTIYQHASSGMDDSSFISYNITSDHNHAVSYAVFNVNNGEAPWYLPFCATMPYDSAEPEKAAQFVRDNAAKEASTQIGDAIFDIYPNDNGGAMLTITAAGYQAWCLEQIK